MPSCEVELSVKATVSGSAPDRGAAEKAAAGPLSDTAMKPALTSLSDPSSTSVTVNVTV